MLTRLMPDQVAKFWDVIKYAVEEAMPPMVGAHIDRLNRILSSILSGRTTCWAYYRKEEDKVIFEGICLTQFLYDEASHTKNLLLYCVYGYEESSDMSWNEAFVVLAKYAKYHKCNEIVGYTNVKHLIERAKKMGGNTDYTFISFNINKVVKFINGLEE